MAWPISKQIMYFLFRLFFVNEITGVENIPKKGGFILAANHSSYLDGPLLLFTVAKKANTCTHLLMTKERYNTWFWRLIFDKWFKVVRVNGAVETALAVLRRKEAIGMFPEGGRSRDGKLRKVTHTGLGVFAIKTKFPVIPVGIEGTFEVWPRYNKLPRFRRIVKIHFGKPMQFKISLNKKNINFVSKTVMTEVGNLTGKKYPG